MRFYSRLFLASVAIALTASVGAAQTPAKAKPPKFPKSDNHGPKSNGSELAGGAADTWILRVPEVCEALGGGKVKSAEGNALTQESQSELLAILAGPEKAAACAKPGKASTVGRADLSRVASTAPVALRIERSPAAVRADVLSNLTTAGAPADKASALLATLEGILSAPRKSQLAKSVDRFNELVNSASDAFLANPPADFIAIHGILARLLRVDEVH